jgi:hypothetical protein
LAAPRLGVIQDSFTGKAPEKHNKYSYGVKMKRLFAGLIFTLLAANLVFASDWQFYGSARIQTFIEEMDYGQLNKPSETTFTMSLQDNSRIGARVRMGDQVTGRFEYGGGGDLRILYGEWDFGKGSLLIGQTYSPLNINYSNQVWKDDKNLTDVGGVYSSRNPMIRLKIGGFQVALVKPDNPSFFGLDTEVKWPKIEAKYKYSQENWEVQIAGGYNTYKELYNQKEYTVNAYILALGGSINFGKLFLGGTIWSGKNPGSYVLENQTFDIHISDIVGDSVWDNDCIGLSLVAGYTVSERLYLEAGYGYSQADLDYAFVEKDKMYSYYLQTRFTLAPGVYIIPEVGVLNLGKFLNTEMGEVTYGGAKWQIDF